MPLARPARHTKFLKPKALRPLTPRQFQRMLTDRSEEIAEIVMQELGIDELPESCMEALRVFISENYCADKGVEPPVAQTA